MTETPKKVWMAMVLMGAALSVALYGDFHSREMQGDCFQPIVFALGSFGVALVLSILGIVSVAFGARQKPRSTATQAAIIAGVLFSVGTIYGVFCFVRLFVT